MLEKYISVDLLFPNNWELSLLNTGNKGEIIPFNGTEKKQGLSFVYEYSEDNMLKLEESIMEIIKHNKDKEVKDNLYAQMVTTLKKTFESHNLDELKQLYDEFDSIKGKFENKPLDENKPRKKQVN